MEHFKETGRRISSMLLVLLLCAALMPAGAFAEGEGDVTGTDEVAAETVETSAAEESAAAEEQAAGEETAEPSEETAECAHASLKRIPAVSARCNKEGVREHYQCTECGRKFFDAEAAQPAEDSDVVIPADPDAHEWGEWEKTREATPEEAGELTRICKLCGSRETQEFEYVEPVDPGKRARKFTLNGINVKFKKEVCTEPDKKKDLRPGRVWIKGQKNSMKVSWENPADLSTIDGVIILRASGSSKVFNEVARLKFKTFKDGKITSKEKTTYTDKTAKKKNTAYTYRVISYYELSDITYVSNITKNDWAAGQTSTSKLKNVYSAKINKKSAKLQSKDLTALKLTVSSPKTKYMASSRRWSSSNKDVATVNSKGKVRAKAPGSATISCRLASGSVITSKIRVVGAFKPGKATLEVDYATTSSINLKWNKVKNATSYDVYKSNDGLHWDKNPKNTKKTTIRFSGLKKGHRYTFYVIARNDNQGLDKDGNSKTYTSLGDNSNVLNQKAVVRRRPMTLTGFPSKVTQKTGTTLSVTIKVNPPLGRKAQLQMKSGRKWVTKKTITLPKGASMKSIVISFPDSWEEETKTEWRLVIPHTTTTSGFTTDTLTVTATRYYQNPSNYVQIKDSISKHGYSHYVSPVLVNGASTRSDHVEALIQTARKYLGDMYVQSRSGAPGNGIDESGLIMQACYGAGVDLWPVSPSTRPYNCVPKIMDSKLQKIKYNQAAEDSNDYVGMYRGDLIFFAETRNGTPIHAAIYTGLGGIIHADPVKGKVNTSTIRTLEDRNGDYKYYVVGVRRIFY